MRTMQYLIIRSIENYICWSKYNGFYKKEAECERIGLYTDDFAEVSKHSAKYRSENNLIGPLK